jgi:murein DD-endopeptidase MepM/ murein hydrolase activator NlpD
MKMRMIGNLLPAFTFCIAVILLFAVCALEGEGSVAAAGMQESVEADETFIDMETLKGRRFKFSWTSGERGAVNGIALLKADGYIEGIGSPNETSWLVDSEGRLLFKHADGRVSTRYEKVRRVEGLLCFEGPFLLREGITHHLAEIEGPLSDREHWITPEDAGRIKYSTQRFFYLDPGESYTFRLDDGRSKRIRLVSVEEYEDPVIQLTRRADVKIEIDGKPVKLSCAPYAMPRSTEGIRIQADTTSAWLNIPKRVQFSLWDASDPVVDTNLFCFPLPDYRLFSHGMQAYNEPVHLGHRDGDPEGQHFYHNYGVDLAGYEFRQKVVSCIDGVVVSANHGEGDLAIRDDQGLVFHYGHLDAILSGIRVGSQVKKGQWVGMLGRRGPSGNFSHLHIGVFMSEFALSVNRSSRVLNLYPWLVAAYQEESGTDLYAVARPHKTARTGDRVVFDGANSLAFKSKITSYRWEFHDGTTMNGQRVEKVYEQPGCHVAALWVEDDRGGMDVDFCKVKVYSRSAPESVVPTLFVTYKPSRDVRVDQPLYFRIWPQGLSAECIRVDFGDGTVIEDYRPYTSIFHAFKKPGIHIVTVMGTAGGLPMTQKVKVVVQD